MITGAFILGAGRAGRGLARALRASGVPLLALQGRQPELEPDQVRAGPLPHALLGADLILVAVRDGQIDAAFDELLAAEPRDSTVFLHLSGSAEPRMLSVMRDRGFDCGTFHPLLPLARPERAPALFRGGWVGVDGDDRACAVGAWLAAALGARTLQVPPGAKVLYHAAAVMASNLSVMLAGEAERVMQAAGVDRDAARGAIGTLFAAAAQNVLADGAAALTGPLVRGESETIQRHLSALRPFPDILRAYIAVSLAAHPSSPDVVSVLEQAEREML